MGKAESRIDGVAAGAGDWLAVMAWSSVASIRKNNPETKPRKSTTMKGRGADKANFYQNPTKYKY